MQVKLCVLWCWEKWAKGYILQMKVCYQYCRKWIFSECADITFMISFNWKWSLPKKFLWELIGYQSQGLFMKMKTVPNVFFSHKLHDDLLNQLTPCLANLLLKESIDTVYCQLRAWRVLSILEDVPVKTRRAWSLYKVYDDSALLVLNGTSLNSDSALLVLNMHFHGNVRGEDILKIPVEGLELLSLWLPNLANSVDIAILILRGSVSFQVTTILTHWLLMNSKLSGLDWFWKGCSILQAKFIVKGLMIPLQLV